MSKKTILTGLRANSDLHIGNYFGGLKPIVDLAHTKSDEYQINLFVPDLHSFTTSIDHSKLNQQILHNLKLFVAAGLPLDKSNVHVYRQSYIPAHSELTWILDCYTGVGEMSRMTQFKDKSGDLNSDRTSVGLFNYPVLMAADILLYNAEYVPVGDDQAQHIEFARDIAERLNAKFDQELFILPKSAAEQHKFFGSGQGLRVKDLADPTKKMSKSSESDKGIVFLTDDLESARKKIMSAATDNHGEIKYDRDERPGISNLLEILALLRQTPFEEVVKQYKGQSSYNEFKSTVADAAINFLAEFQKNLAKVDEAEIVKKLEASEKEMAEVAGATLLRVQKAVGLR